MRLGNSTLNCVCDVTENLSSLNYIFSESGSSKQSSRVVLGQNLGFGYCRHPNICSQEQKMFVYVFFVYVCLFFLYGIFKKILCILVCEMPSKHKKRCMNILNQVLKRSSNSRE